MTTSVLWLTVPVWWTLILSGALAQGTAKLYDYFLWYKKEQLYIAKAKLGKLQYCEQQVTCLEGNSPTG